jgi:hypothetical protein
MSKDFNGKITLAQFSNAVEQRKPKAVSGEAAWYVILGALGKDPSSCDRAITRMFKTFDSDGSGSIDIRSWLLYLSDQFP